MRPLALTPDWFVVNRGDRLDVGLTRLPDSTRIYPDIHYSLYADAAIHICDRDERTSAIPSCGPLERSGHLIVGDSTAALIPRFRVHGRPVVRSTAHARRQKLFGLTRYRLFRDTGKLSFEPDGRLGGRHYLKVTGCGETWAGYRLVAHTQVGEVINYPLDRIFSDTVRVTGRGC